MRSGLAVLACCLGLVSLSCVERTAPTEWHRYGEKGMIAGKGETKCETLSNFALDADGNILACDEAQKLVRVVSPDDKLRTTWKLDFPPQAIERRADGSIVVAGGGKVALLGKAGKVKATGSLPVPEYERTGIPERDAMMARYMEAATGVACTGDDVFVAARGKKGYSVYRFDSKLQQRKEILSGLRGCCGQMDIAAQGGALYVAANCNSKVIKYSRDGKILTSFGKRGRNADTCFGGCCEPKNVCIGPDGNVYTAESFNGSVKHFTPDGKFLGVVAAAKGITGCVRVSLGFSKDGSKLYMLDDRRNAIRVFRRH